MLSERVPTRYQRCLHSLSIFNCFASTPATTNQHRLINEFIASAFFIIIFLISLAALIFFAWTTNDLITIKRCSSNESSSLPCRCSQSAVVHNQFIRLDFIMHQVCLSDFVASQWLHYLQVARGNTPLLSTDFRNTILAIFQVLRNLCHLGHQTAYNSLTRFYQHEYINRYVVPLSLFMAQIQSLINEFILSTVQDFMALLHTIHEIVQTNTMASASIIAGYASNYTVVRPMSYGSCACGGPNECTIPSSFYNGMTNQVLWMIPGMFSGCDIFLAISMSTVECLYNQTCLNQLRSYLNSNATVSARVLDAHQMSIFTPTSTVGMMMNEMMIERWNMTVSYEAYLEACDPVGCESTINAISYILERKQPLIQIIAIVIGLVGGLVGILQFFIPCMVNFIRKENMVHVVEISRID